MTIAAIILAAGRGERAGAGAPKQYRAIGGEPVLAKSVRAFLGHPEISLVRVVINPQHEKLYRKAVHGLDLPEPVAGGVTRQDSVLCGLEALEKEKPEIVLIHDSARAFASQGLISRVIAAVKQHRCGAVPALAVGDTLKKAENLAVVETVSREGLYLAQTPQGFPYPGILDAHRKAKHTDYTDDAAVAEAAGLKVVLVAGEKENVKLTHAEDFRKPAGEVRTGSGFDVHAFTAGDHVVLCGVKIPHGKALAGHSDADAGLHAITDALLGAIGAGDIGDHFPPSEAKWKDASSDIFLKRAAELVKEAGGLVLNVDLTLICEGPKIGPHRQKMRENVAKILAIDPGRVSVKATTTEKLGFAGRGEGLAAQAVATVGF